MNSRFRTFGVQAANTAIQIVPTENRWRRIVIVAGGLIFISAVPTTGVDTGAPGGGDAVRLPFAAGGRGVPVFYVAPNQGLYAFVGDAGVPTQVSVAIMEVLRC